MSGDLIAFLTARLDEDERLARAYLDNAIARKRPGPERWAYARVLSQVEAVRPVIRRWERAMAIPEPVVSFTAGQDDGYRQACEDALRDAAAIWNSHPDYQQEWSELASG